MQYTDQQDRIIQRGVAGDSFKIQALAGTGKTSTLVAMAQAISGRRGRYLAFNKAIAREAQSKFGSNVKAGTMHALAFGKVGRLYAHRLEGGDAGKLSPIRLLHHYQYRKIGSLAPLTRAGMVKATLSKYLNDDAPVMGRQHLPLADLNVMAIRQQWNPADIAYVEETLLSDASLLWRDMLSEESGLPFMHDAYVRLYVDSEPQIGADFCLVDEAQDTSRLFLKFLRQQESQIIIVGDSNQQIYAWREAVDVLDQLDDYTTEFLSTSFRFGNHIAGAANEVLKDLESPILMRGTEADRSALSSRALLYRTNAGVFGALMKRGLGEQKKKVHVEGGVDDLRKMLDAVEQLQMGSSTMHPDFIGYQDWNHVQEAAEAYAAPAEIRLVVKVVDEFPMVKLREALDEAKKVSREQADIVASTAHKSKGLEFAEVGVGNDFNLPEKNPLIDASPINDEEKRLRFLGLP